MQSLSLGITLVEFIIYLTISLFLISSLFSWIVNTGIPLMHASKKNNIVAQTYSALQVFTRDVKQAPAIKQNWKKITDLELIWHTDTTDIGWQLTGNRLIRSVGIYNETTRQWTKKVSSLVATHIENGCFTIFYVDQYIEKVMFYGLITSVGVEIAEKVFLQNRIVT